LLTVRTHTQKLRKRTHIRFEVLAPVLMITGLKNVLPCTVCESTHCNIPEYMNL